METKKCPSCGEEILAAAKKCKHCGEWLDKATTIKLEQKVKPAKKKPVKAIIIGGIAAIVVIVVSFEFLLTNPLSSSVGNTAVIKKSILDTDYSISIGDALDNYKYFTKTEWKEFKTSQGKEIVEFEGNYSKNDVIVIIQFILNKNMKENEEGKSFRLGFQGYSYVTESGEKQEIKDENLINMIYNNKEISVLSYLIVQKKTELFITGVEESFLIFLKEFIENRNSQIALINNPLIHNVSYLDDEGEIVEKKELLNEADLEKNWSFLNEKEFFQGLKTIDGQEYSGKWNESNNIVAYEKTIPESAFFEKYIFKKINGKWCLFEYEYNNI